MKLPKILKRSRNMAVASVLALSQLGSLAAPFIYAKPVLASHVTPINMNNLPQQNKCALIATPGETWIEFSIGNNGPDVADGVYTDGTITVTIFNSVPSGGGGVLQFDWSSNLGVDAAIVVGGRQGDNVYFYNPADMADDGLRPGAPTGRSEVSEALFCYQIPVAPRTGTVELQKVWVGNGGQTTLNIGTTAGGSQVDTQLTGVAGSPPLSTGQNAVNAGIYFMSESGLPTYITRLVCFNDANNNGQNDNEPAIALGPNASAPVAVGQHVICLFTNTRERGRIELQKDFVGTPGTVTIKIGTTQNGSEVDSDILFADGTSGEHTLDTGTYFVSETLTMPANYTAVLACYNDVNDSDTVDSGDTPHVVNTSTGGVAVRSGEDVICVFTNSRNTGSVKVNKLLDSDANGTFETTNPASFNWSLDGNGTNAMGSTVSGVNTGNHFVNENSVTGFHFVGWYPGGLNSTQFSCTNFPGANTTLPANISVSTNATTEITLCNAVDPGLISGIKFKVATGATDGSQGTPLSGWTIFIDENNNGTLDPNEAFAVTDAQGNYSFLNLAPGTYQVCEVLQTGWTRVFPANCLSVQVDPGEADEDNDFGNRQNGTVIICENDVDIDNDTDQDADSGNAGNSGNTTGGGAQSGDAGNSNSTNTNVALDCGGGNGNGNNGGNGGQVLGSSTSTLPQVKKASTAAVLVNTGQAGVWQNSVLSLSLIVATLITRIFGRRTNKAKP